MNKCIKQYDVTITRTGGITVEAGSEAEAIEKVLSMTIAEIESKGNLTGWEPSDAIVQDYDSESIK